MWRKRASGLIAARIAAHPPLTPQTLSPVVEASLPLIVTLEHRGHRVFRISELLGNILEVAGPESQVQALRVSFHWHSSALAIIRCQNNKGCFRASDACLPVEYGQIIALNATPTRPSADELGRFGEKLLGLLQLRRRARYPLFPLHELFRSTHDDTYIYFPARYSQIRDLPDDIAQCLNDLDFEQRHKLHDGVTSVSRETDVHWLDLSQVTINPYFWEL